LTLTLPALPPLPTCDIVFVDDCLVVANKPSGLLSVPGRGEDKQDCVSARVQGRYADALIVHRLDMATSGLMLLARGPDMQRTLSQAFAARTVFKRYSAVVHGQPAPPTDGWGCIDLPIALDWPNRPLRIIDAQLGKPSITRWQIDASTDGVGHSTVPRGCTRLLLEPLTGRSHQLRVHLAALGHPIVGDALYAPPAVQALSNRLLLHASQLGFAHPKQGESMLFTSNPPF
jgi:tRNA pseudouridine32 synthase / 23S rRNA pseudouridine746 synthase